MKETELAWLAGYIDGDGCIAFHRKGKDRPRHAVAMVVTVDSADVELLDEVQRLAGGSRVAKKKYKDNHRQTYTWRLTGSAKIVDFLRQILPYLRCEFKRQRAQLIVTHWEACTPANGRYTPEMLAAKEDLVDRVLALGVGRGRRRHGQAGHE